MTCIAARLLGVWLKFWDFIATSKDSKGKKINSSVVKVVCDFGEREREMPSVLYDDSSILLLFVVVICVDESWESSLGWDIWARYKSHL